MKYRIDISDNKDTNAKNIEKKKEKHINYITLDNQYI